MRARRSGGLLPQGILDFYLLRLILISSERQNDISGTILHSSCQHLCELHVINSSTHGFSVSHTGRQVRTL